MTRLLNYTDLRDRGIRYSRQHLHRLVLRGLFPHPIKLGAGGTNLWVDSEIEQYLKELVVERDAKRGIPGVFAGGVKAEAI
jgi:prophage regulatory protein